MLTQLQQGHPPLLHHDTPSSFSSPFCLLDPSSHRPSLHTHTLTHTHTYTHCCLLEIRSPAQRPHTWACLRRKRALGGLRSMRLSTGSTKSGQLCSWPGLALWGLCSWERHVSQKRRKKDREGRREGGHTEEKKGEKRALGYFELITHSSLSSPKASPFR